MASREDELGNIGTALLFENDRVRVWDMVLEPGEACELHRHMHDYLWVDIGLCKKEVIGPWGGPDRLVLHEDGFVQYNVVGERGRAHKTGIKNVGDTVQRQIIVEFLGESVAREEQDRETNGRERSL